MSIVYLHKSLNSNEVFYVGIGKNDKRAYYKHGRSKYWKNSVEKYGLNVEITHRDILWDDACKIEQYLISFWRENSKLKICNLTDGGDGVLGMKVSEERKKRYSNIFLGEKNPFYGKKHSDVTRKKMSENNNPRKKITQEHKNRISNSNKGKKRTDETKIKLSELKKGKPTWNKGVECKKETREKLSKALKEYYKKRNNEVYNGGQANNTEVSVERVG